MFTLAYILCQLRTLILGDSSFLSSVASFRNTTEDQESSYFPPTQLGGAVPTAPCLMAYHSWARIQSLDEDAPWCPPWLLEGRKMLERLEMTKCFYHLYSFGEWLWLKIYIKSFQSGILKQSFLIFCFELSLFWHLPTFRKMKGSGSCQTTSERTLKPK